jgi:hypothetical protein
MNQIQLDASEMKNFMHHMIKNNRHIQASGKTPVSTEIIGDSGLGKTSVALQLAQELGLNFVKLNLAQIEELGDLVGFPVKQFELVKAGNAPAAPSAQKFQFVKTQDAEGKTVMKKVPVEEPTQTISAGSGEKIWADEMAVESYLKQGYIVTGKNRMSYCAPEWIADKEDGGILILDDWNRADIRFIQAIMELVDRQEYISWKLPKDWHIVLTANPDNGEYLVNSIDVAQKTRFVSTILKWNHERWAEWAEQNGVDGRCINFVLGNPEIVGENKGVNPRSLTTFFNSISSFENFNEQLSMIQMVGEGSVGPEVTTLFTSFIKNKLDKLITPKDMLLREGTETVMAELKACMHDGSDYRADIASILTTRLINFAVHYSKSNPITPEIIQRIQALIKTPDVFTDDLKYVIVKKILNGNKQKFQKLVSDPTVQDLATK